ncbi:MAG: septal ring lytic transglycosylase RlpA family protein [Arenimonas sp.]|nr:septal ring lytic transglycosylase RlpA family protein [Arenimonas sp.]
MRRRRALALLALAATGPGARAQGEAGTVDAVQPVSAEPDAPDADGKPPPDWTERGEASWYGLAFQGRRTASGERFDMHKLTAAHPSLPFGTRVRVTSLRNGRSVVVRINDRGPHTGGRIIDLSHAAARRIGLLVLGTKDVELALATEAEAAADAASRPAR